MRAVDRPGLIPGIAVAPAAGGAAPPGQGGPAGGTASEWGKAQHPHGALAVDDSGESTDATGRTWAQALKGRVGDPRYSVGQAPNLTMGQQTVLPTGGSQPHNNLQPNPSTTVSITH